MLQTNPKKEGIRAWFGVLPIPRNCRFAVILHVTHKSFDYIWFNKNIIWLFDFEPHVSLLFCLDIDNVIMLHYAQLFSTWNLFCGFWLLVRHDIEVLDILMQWCCKFSLHLHDSSNFILIPFFAFLLIAKHYSLFILLYLF